MSTKRCYYETLEVERNADDSKLKAAFRKLAMKWHPDKNPGDATSEVRFKEINEAYEVLKDGDKRAAYDRYGHAAFEQGMGGGGPGFGAGFASSFSDIFEDLFGMAGQRRGGGTRARRRPALQHGNHARGSVPGQDGADRNSGLGHLRTLLGHRRQGRHQA
jgi:molecular chaperone DnaJ